MNLLKKLFLQKKIKDYKKYYYKNLFPLLNAVDVIKRSKSCYNVYLTNTVITLRNSINLSDTTEKVLNTLENKKYQNFYVSNKYKIIFYKQKINSLKIKLQLHFYNEKLFYAAQIFSNLDELKQNELINLIKIKYNLQEYQDLSIPFAIKDKHENLLFVEKYFYFILNYISGDYNTISNIIDELVDNQKHKSIPINFMKYI